MGWLGWCVVTRPVLPASELTLGVETARTDRAGITRVWRSLAISPNGRTELELTLGRKVVFLDTNGGFHGLTSVAGLLDDRPDAVFF